jgi:hypothetical protein
VSGRLGLRETAGRGDRGLGQAWVAQDPGGGLAGPDQALAWEVPDQSPEAGRSSWASYPAFYPHHGSSNLQTGAIHEAMEVQGCGGALEKPFPRPAGSWLADLGSRMQGVTSEDDIAALASQLADLTRVVEDLAGQITTLREHAASQQDATNLQQERIELAARELAGVSSRLHLAGDALRTVI